MIITHKNFADEATLECPLEVSTLPATNLQKRLVAQKWRTQGVDSSTSRGSLQWLKGDLEGDTIPGLMSLVEHNFSQDATLVMAITKNTNETTLGDFASGANYTLDSGLSVSSNQLVLSSATGSCIPDTNELECGKNYIIRLTVSGYTGGSIYASVHRAAGGWQNKSTHTYCSANGEWVIFINGDYLDGAGDYLGDPAYWRIRGVAATATIENVRIYESLNDNTHNADGSDSGEPLAFPLLEIFGAKAWGLFQWDGKISEEDRDKMRLISRYFIPPDEIVKVPAAGGFFWVLPYDTNNSDGYYEAGRLIVANYFQPQINPQYGFKIKYKDLSGKTITDGGLKYIDQNEIIRYFDFDLKHLNKASAMGAQHHLNMVMGNQKDFLILITPGDDEAVQQLSLYGTLDKEISLSWDYCDGWSTAYTVEEQL